MSNKFAKAALGLMAILLLAGAAYYWRMVREIPVRVAAPEQNVEVRVFGIGTIEAQIVAKVGFPIGGRLVALEADQGDFIEKGALLARLDDETQRAKLAKSEAAQRQAAANLTKVQAQRDRAQVAYEQKRSVNVRRQTLAGRGTVSQEAAEDAQAAEAIAQTDVKVIEADAMVAAVLRDDAAAQRLIDQALFDQHTLRAPFDARVIARHKELGSVVNAGELVFTLVAPETIWVRAFVDEALAGGLQVGQTAFVRLRSQPDRLFETTIVRIDQENDRVTEERRVYVRCRACDPQHQLRFLGEQAEVEIVARVIPEGLFLPLRLVEGYDGRNGTVWTLENGRLVRRQVAIGDRLLDGRVQVLSGVPNGAAVVIEDAIPLRIGRAARALPTRPAQTP
jgi:HlyD family secretion protein